MGRPCFTTGRPFCQSHVWDQPPERVSSKVMHEQAQGKYVVNV
jgi:hypothetical protein